MALLQDESRRLGAWCWRRALGAATDDEATLEAVLDLCLRAGRTDAAEEYARKFFDSYGLRPAAAVRATACFVLHDAFDAALRTFDRVLELSGGDVASRSPAPTIGAVCGDELRARLAMRIDRSGGARAPGPDLNLGFARLCFTFAVFDLSARLFEHARGQGRLDVDDMLRYAYALSQSRGKVSGGPVIEALARDSAESPADPDRQMLLATVLFAGGAPEAAGSAVEASLRARFDRHPELEAIVDDCRRMVASIARCPDLLHFPGDRSSYTRVVDRQPIRKIFVCGNGWSGSGALYDALSEYEGVAVVPEGPGDRYLNACTGNETMFVQGTAGLGRIWRAARVSGHVSRADLWDLFRCHVSGAGAIGYSERKAARAAATLINHLGSRYTGIFCGAFETLASMSSRSSLGELKNVLVTTTESLSASLAGGGDKCVLFNNAVFGPNIDMLEIFCNFKAAVVTRDPLDQYADRRAQDLKHWMTPSRFISFYRDSREAFHIRRSELPAELAQDVREIEFEQFVADDAYRESVVDWLLDGEFRRTVRGRFDANRSVKNVRIHERLLSPDEQDVLAKGLQRWRRT